MSLLLIFMCIGESLSLADATNKIINHPFQNRIIALLFTRGASSGEHLFFAMKGEEH
jgi:hypothetical protein